MMVTARADTATALAATLERVERGWMVSGGASTFGSGALWATGSVGVTFDRSTPVS